MVEIGPPARDVFMPGDARRIISPGARKEALRKRSFPHPSPAPRARWAELRCASAFSFLEGASEPETLVERAAELGLPAVALVDRNGVSGAPRFFKAAKAAGLKVGAYWYSYAASVEDAKAEAQTCINAIKGKTFEYPIYFDLEERSQFAKGRAFCNCYVTIDS